MSELDDCIQEQLERFSTYDQAVDVVSCLHSYLDYNFRNDSNYPDYFFDRFPTLDQAGEDSALTPDFAVYFNDTFGIIGEIKRVLPTDDRAFRKGINQLENYCRSLPLSTSSGDSVAPETCKVFLLLSQTEAPKIGYRLQEFVDENPNHLISDCVVPVRYQSNQQDALFRYEFQRVATYDSGFEDQEYLGDKSFHNKIGEGGGFSTIESYPRHFGSYKITYGFCNDCPPSPYLATYIWHHLLPEAYLDPEDMLDWRKGNVQKKIPILIEDESELEDAMNEALPFQFNKTTWIDRMMNFLFEAGLAHKTPDGIEIQFGTVQTFSPRESFQAGQSKQVRFKDLGKSLIRKFCESRHEEASYHDPDQTEIVSDE